jgi:hypothetical protein
VPASIALSHEAQREALVRQCPPAADIAVVVGDPCYDQLHASIGLRERYRDALGVASNQRLVLVTSTWGPHSLFGRHPGLPGKLLRELDPRRYQVAAMIHPAAWFGHGRRQLRAWLTEERAAGLLLIEPEVDWRAVVVAADQLIGDHGSTTVYAAAIGKRVLHTDLPVDELDPSSAQAFLGARAPRLRRFRPIERQLRHTAPGEWTAEVTARLTSRPDQAHRLLRDEMYRLLTLSAPGRHRAVEPVPTPYLGSESRRA